MYPILCKIIWKYGNTYDFILLDPIWTYRKFYTSKLPYECQTFMEIIYALVIRLRRKNSLIGIWVTGTHLFWALHCLNVWGYRFINILIVWRKIKADGTTQGRTLGAYSRISCEYLLLGCIGTIGQFRSNVRNLNQYLETYQLDAQRTKHSEKP